MERAGSVLGEWIFGELKFPYTFGKSNKTYLKGKISIKSLLIAK